MGMGGGSVGFAGSVASFCMALLKAYCKKTHVVHDINKQGCYKINV